MDDPIKQAQEYIQTARRVFVLTGAGISAESGVATFRDAGGLWKQIDPKKVATPEAFAADPEFVWRWYDQRRTQLKDCEPNPGHHAVAHLEKAKGEGFFLLTQNVDDLHERAGSLRIVHIHGKIYQVKCIQEGTVREDRRVPLPEIPPRCPQCGALERPNVVWFGEMIDMNAARETERFLSQGKADVVLVIGTEASFGYIVEWSHRAKGRDGVLIEVNPGQTALTLHTNLHIQGKAGEVLPLLTQNLI